ncbi:hypothetical protein [Bacteroides acidifaciens]|uniref:hypothetical protein n=1 Tax=Bacteroides acidifaciens TaxID=85831 RepID=UPI0025A980A5|nr:hypothetical protein [Bacteroides acidifaciens]
MSEKKRLTGNIVGHASGIRDVMYGSPDFDGAEFLGVEMGDPGVAGDGVQFKFKLKNGNGFDVLLLPTNY